MEKIPPRASAPGEDPFRQDLSDTPQPTPEKEYRTGTRLYLLVGLLAGGLYAFTGETPKSAPYRWLLLSIAIVSLIRSMWYAIKGKQARDSAKPDGETGLPKGQ